MFGAAGRAAVVALRMRPSLLVLAIAASVLAACDAYQVNAPKPKPCRLATAPVTDVLHKTGGTDTTAWRITYSTCVR